MQLLGNEDDLCKRQRVDERELVQREGKVILGKDHGFIGFKQGEHNKEVEKQFRRTLSPHVELSASEVAKHLNQTGHHAGPSGLVAAARAGSVVGVEVS